MRKRKVELLMFSIGAVGYGLIEVVWRGYTHWSMLGAGGICFMFFGTLSEKLKHVGILFKGMVGSAFITLTELIFGIVFNVILKRNVWDYSKMPMNVIGQICVPYSFLWVLLSMICIPFAGSVSRRLQTKKQ